MAAFLQGQADQLLTGGNRGQQLAFLCGAAQLGDQGGGDQHRRLQRGRAQVAPRLLQHQPQAGIAVSQATEFLVDSDAGPAHLRHLAPDVAVKALFAAAVAQRAQLGHGRFFREETRG